MKRWLPAVLSVVGGLGPAAVACSARRGPPAGQGTDDAGEPPETASPTTDGGLDGDEASTVSQAYVRIAQLSPDLPPVDVCVASHGTGSFQGPLLAQLPADASAPGVAYAQLSAYLPLDPGAYDVRIVAAGASSCAPVGVVDAAAWPDSFTLAALVGGAFATLLIAGELVPAGGDPPLTVALLGDDAVLGGGAASLRAINAMPGEPSLDFGLGSSATSWMPLFIGVHFAATSANVDPDDAPADANGYVPIAPFAATQAMSARASSSDAAADVAAASSVAIPLGAIATLIAIGGVAGDPTHPPALLLCTDNQPSGGLLADCSIAQ
jgi:hypothetical protein